MVLSLARVKSAALTFGLIALSHNFVEAGQVRRPLRLKINTDVLKTLFHKGDQRVLDAFTDLQVTIDEPEEKCPDFANTVFSLTTDEGIDPEEYDFDVHLNGDTKGSEDDSIMGFEGKNLRIVGTAAFRLPNAEGEAAPVAKVNEDGEAEAEVEENTNKFSYSAPVKNFRLTGEFAAEDNPDVVKYNRNSQKPQVKEFQFELGSITFEDGSNVPEGCFETIHEGVTDGVNAIYDDLMSGDLDSLSLMPVESFLPIILIRHIGGFAIDQSVTSTAIEYGFDPEMVFEQSRPIPKKKAEMLKEIKSEFSNQQDSDKPIMVSFIMDENLINSFLLEFVLVEKAFSMREFFRLDPRLAEALKHMTTEALQPIIPNVVEEFGNRPIDLYISLSHSLVANKLEGVKATGF